nr:hypothetical protein Iba_chr03cCG7920 [Ipomoea batatas]
MSPNSQLHPQALGGGHGSERRQISPALQLLRLWVVVADLNDGRCRQLYCSSCFVVAVAESKRRQMSTTLVAAPQNVVGCHGERMASVKQGVMRFAIVDIIDSVVEIYSGILVGGWLGSLTLSKKMQEESRRRLLKSRRAEPHLWPSTVPPRRAANHSQPVRHCTPRRLSESASATTFNIPHSSPSERSSSDGDWAREAAGDSDDRADTGERMKWRLCKVDGEETSTTSKQSLKPT